MGFLTTLLAVPALATTALAWGVPSGNSGRGRFHSSQGQNGNHDWSHAPSQSYNGSNGWSHEKSPSYNGSNSWSHGPSQSYNGSNAWSNPMPQTETNGLSNFGTLERSGLGPWVNGPMPQGRPWGARQCNDTNPYQLNQIPNTGMTRYYQWTLTNETMAPDGVSMPMLVVNNQFPGPLIEANWGDWIEVTVKNEMTEGTAIHWHGFLQTGTAYMDGVPGISQCPIAPGKSFTYKFRAELYGSSWWHGHYSAQYINGMSGPIVIHGPKNADYDIDVGPVMLTDWFHDYYLQLVWQAFHSSKEGPILPPMANNMLINGKANYNCSNTKLPCKPDAGLAQFKFQSGKKHLLRLINHGAEAVIFFSIDGYKMTVVANDYVPIHPYETDLVTLAVGQRADVIVEAKGNPTDAVWMRMSEGPSGLGPVGQTGCSLNDGLAFETVAAIYYENADTSIPPNTTSSIDPKRYLFPTACSNSNLNQTVPTFEIPIKEPTVTLDLLMTGRNNATGEFIWWINNRTFVADYNDPTLLEAKLGQIDFGEKKANFDLGTNTTVRIIMHSVGFPASHPMHIHGHNLQVLAEGPGTWNGTIVNAANPQRRDTQLIRPAGFLVVQFDLDNPGVWPFHCHVAWHISEGMNINLIEQTPTLQSELEIPYIMAQTCRDWSEYTGKNVVEQIDSGL